MIRLFNPWVILASLGLAVATFIYGTRVGANGVLAENAKTVALVEGVEERAEKGTAAAIAKNRPIVKVSQGVVERETIEKPVYRDCVHSPDSLRALQAILENRPLLPGDSVVPGADAPR